MTSVHPAQTTLPATLHAKPAIPTGATSKQAQSERNLAALEAWLSQAEASGTITTVGVVGAQGFKVNRTHAAKACGFARSAFSTNPAFVDAVSAFEERQNAHLDNSSSARLQDASGDGRPQEAGTNGSIGTASAADNAHLRKALDARDKEISNLRRRLHAKCVEAEQLRDELRKTRTFFDTVLHTGLPFPGKGTP